MLRGRDERGYFIGLYLEKQQYEIVHSVAASLNVTVSNLLRMSIARDIEPIYQSIKAKEVETHEQTPNQ